MASILGIDYGAAKIGLAIAPKGGTVAVLYGVLRPVSPEDLYKKIHQICREEDVQEIVVGIPKSMKSQEELEEDPVFKKKSETQISTVRDFIALLEKETGLMVHEVNEWYTTKEANKLLNGHPKDLEDAVSAMIILQAYLDTLHHDYTVPL